MNNSGFLYSLKLGLLLGPPTCPSLPRTFLVLALRLMNPRDLLRLRKTWIVDHSIQQQPEFYNNVTSLC